MLISGERKSRADEEEPRRMEQLGVLGVEPDRQLQHLGHVQRADLGVLDEAGGEGRVVPGGVGQVHADVQARLGRHRPVGGDQQGRGDRDRRARSTRRAARAARWRARRAARRRCRCRRPPRRPRPAPSPAGRGSTTPDQLQDHDQQRESQHDLGKPRGGPRPARSSRPRRRTAPNPSAASTTSSSIDPARYSPKVIATSPPPRPRPGPRRASARAP